MSTLAQIVKKFDGFDLDEDQANEIEALKFLAGVQRPSEPVHAGKKLVLVCVESRLLKRLAGSSYSVNELKQRLATLKQDLLREGRQALVLQMEVYDGPEPQDTKTLLAIREFFRAVRTAFSNLEGAILIGSFPDASLVRMWPAQVSGGYRVGLTPGQPHRFEIVLGDLNGNWRELYHWETEVAQHDFEVVPGQTTVTMEGSKVILLNPRITKAPRTERDVLVIGDAAFSITPQEDGSTRVELDMKCQDPEVSQVDKTKANPVAAPDISVSRINARAVAVMPPADRLLDANGKPRTVPSAPPIDLSPEAWRPDAKLERRLLIEYLDRNHAFRRGHFSDHGFDISVLQCNYPTSVVEEGLAGLTGTRHEVREADLLAMARWLKRPTALRAFSTHADCAGTHLRPDDSSAAEAEAEAGGHPWRWVEEGGYYVPSFKGHSHGDLRVYRTLWENQMYGGVLPGLVVHPGCDVNGARHLEASYSSPSYAAFQHAEALLFYGNALAVLAHATWWNRGPCGFGKAFGASRSAVMGDGWKEISETTGRDAALGQQTTERKQNYIWSVLGDWTLQKYYPAWPYGRRINDCDATPEAMAAAAFNDQLYVFWPADDSWRWISCSDSADGVAWPGGRQINDMDSTPAAPAACAFNGRLYLFWRANDEGRGIFWSATPDGRAWPHGRGINAVDTTPCAPACCVFNGRLYVFWKANDPGNAIYYSASPDGLTWPAGRTINDSDSTPCAPACCVFDGRLYVFWKSDDAEDAIYYSASEDGLIWPGGQKINEFDATPEAPAACEFGGKLYVFWRAREPANAISYGGSADGLNWPNSHRLNDFDSSAKSPAVCAFKDSLYVFWQAPAADQGIWFSLNDGKHRI